MKIGVYFCKCGTNVSEKIDPDKVQKSALEFPGVAYCKNSEYLCSEEGKTFLVQDLLTEKPDRVVIAACSPRDYEKTFRGCLGNANMNPYFMQMVNIREQVAWVTEDPNQAASKATAYIRAAAARVGHHAPLQETEIDINPDVLIVGAGPAGLKAALAIARSGRKAVLVEKLAVLGGMPVLFEDLFPNLECAPCMLEPTLAEILQEKQIEILTLSQVQEVVGYCGNFRVKIRQSPRYVDTLKCISCGECINPCPQSAANQLNCGLNESKAISFALTGGLPNIPAIDFAACRRSHGEDCQLCKAACPVEGAIVFDDREKILEKSVGAIVLAVGSSLYDCTNFPDLAYGKVPNVYNSLEFERLLSATGPTGGKVLGKDGKAPESLAIVHCVGSLDSKHVPYCSGVCCQYAFKFNQLVEHRLPEAKVTHLHKELVAPGKEEFALFQRATANANATFIRYNDLSGIQVTGKNGATQVHYKDASGKSDTIHADMVVLCPAIVANGATKTLSGLCEVPLDKFGFFDELHGRADAAQSKIKGIYLAGTCQGPKDIQASMNQGMAAAGQVLSQLPAGKKLSIDPVVASVNEEVCSGCRVCGLVCPYKAISFNAERKVSIVNSVLCHGCGTCVAACPSGALEGSHFTRDQIFAELEGVLQ
jgi:heterodisulfide reductase subunit A